MKKKSFGNEPIPFKRLKDFTKKYPRVWDYCDAFQDGRDVLPQWNDLCQIPIAATLSVMSMYPKDTVDSGIFPAECAALYSWRKFKEIYSFDEDLSNMLMAQAEDIEIPVDVLYSLPYPCIWIQANRNTGFFAWFEDDVNTHIMELRMLVISDDGITANLMLHLKQGWTISDGVKDAVELIKKSLKDPELQAQSAEYGIDMSPKQYREEFNFYFYTEQCRMISQYIQLVLYICAENKDMQENKEQKSITSRSSSGTKPKDVYREIRKWDVGYRVGNAIRKYAVEKQKRDTAYESTGDSNRKRPHTRRGHYHHYWIGSDKNNNRRIILKWVAPMFINGDEEDIIPTQHNVK